MDDFGVNTEEWGASDFFLDSGEENMQGASISEEATGEETTDGGVIILPFHNTPLIT